MGQNTVVGINSWGDKYRYPQVHFSDIIELFKITFVANKVPPTYGPTKEDSEDETPHCMLEFKKSKLDNNIFKGQPSESGKLKVKSF